MQPVIDVLVGMSDQLVADIEEMTLEEMERLSAETEH